MNDSCAKGHEAGVLAYFIRVINSLLADGIEPHVIIYHWDFPQVLEVRRSRNPPTPDTLVR